MNTAKLQDAAQRGVGRAARHIGARCSLFRPICPVDALNPMNQILQLPAAFLAASGRSQSSVGYGQVLWQGLFDTAYTKPGDFLQRPESAPGAGDGGIWFIAAQQPLLPVLCVRVSARIEIHRPVLSATAGIGGNGGAAVASTVAILSGWPAAIVQAEGRGSDPTNLPTDIAPGSWTVLLPAFGSVQLRTNDQIHDDRGRTAIIAAAELTDLGWRLIAREITT